jgi:hypothetical protein
MAAGGRNNTPVDNTTFDSQGTEQYNSGVEIPVNSMVSFAEHTLALALATEKEAYSKLEIFKKNDVSPEKESALQAYRDASAQTRLARIELKKAKERAKFKATATKRAAVRAARGAAAAAAGNNYKQIHKETSRFKSKIPRMLAILKDDLGDDLGGDRRYDNIIDFINASIGRYLEVSPEFDNKTVNSKVVIPKAVWITDYELVISQLRKNERHICDNDKNILGTIIDFVFKHNIQECFVSGFIYDNAHAYEATNKTPVSCYSGIIDRCVTTFINCIMGKTGSVFAELNKLLINIRSWEDLDKGSQGTYIQDWNKFVDEWARSNLTNESIIEMTASERSDAVLEAYKVENEAWPAYVEQYIKDTYIKGLDDVWQDYGYNGTKRPKRSSNRKSTDRKLRKNKSRKTRKLRKGRNL